MRQKYYHGWQHLYYLQVHVTVWIKKKKWTSNESLVLPLSSFFLLITTLTPQKAFFVAVVFYILLHFVDACLHNSSVVYSLAYLSWLLADYSKCIFKDLSGFTICIFRFSQFHLSTVLSFTKMKCMSVWQFSFKCMY